MRQLAIFFFTADRTGAGGDETVYSRMLAPMFGIVKIRRPARSGSARLSLLRYGMATPEQALSMVSLQGVAMERPSRIHISIENRTVRSRACVSAAGLEGGGGSARLGFTCISSSSASLPSHSTVCCSRFACVRLPSSPTRCIRGEGRINWSNWPAPSFFTAAARSAGTTISVSSFTGRYDARLVQLHALLTCARKALFDGRSATLADLVAIAHRVNIFGSRAEHQRRLPVAEDIVFLERGHPAHQALVFERRLPPLLCSSTSWAGGMHAFADSTRESVSRTPEPSRYARRPADSSFPSASY